MLPTQIQSEATPVAYFCAEFALSQDLPIYSGGLGVLAGDVVRQASDQNLPFIGIGLFYRQGYFIQKLSNKGQQQQSYKDINPKEAGLELVQTSANQPLLLIIPHKSSPLCAQVWRYQYQNITLYLLDTNIEQNTTHRDVTKHLYDPDVDTRILQEILLGIGGIKLLQALEIKPTIYHLNEGHSAFATFALSATLMQERGIRFEEALEEAKQHIVFTNHTVVAAGNDRFAKHQLRYHLEDYADAEGLPINPMIEVGTDPQDEELFSMTILALNSSHKANTVSKLHHQIARTVWPDYHFYSITNGVHLPTWVAPNIQQSVPALDLIGLNRLNSNDLWRHHVANKQQLIELVAQTTDTKLDPNALTIVWARRFAGYKRADLVLQDTQELKRLTKDKKVQIIFAGKAHPNDNFGQDIISNINRLIRLSGLEESVVFIPNYSIDIAKFLVAGADVWLNTPRRSQEASGTSGMKSGANGVLQLSISDGWMDEVSWDDVAWILPETHTDEAIYQTLNNQVLPLYNSRDKAGTPMEWTQRMLNTMHIIWPRFSAARMLREYREIFYTPASKEVE